MDKLITSIADVWIDGNDIIHKEVHNNAHVDLNSLKVSFKQTLGYTGPEKRLMLYDLRHHFTITDDALDFFAGHYSKLPGNCNGYSVKQYCRAHND
jgi:hypothetical protein